MTKDEDSDSHTVPDRESSDTEINDDDDSDELEVTFQNVYSTMPNNYLEYLYNINNPICSIFIAITATLNNHR